MIYFAFKVSFLHFDLKKNTFCVNYGFQATSNEKKI